MAGHSAGPCSGCGPTAQPVENALVSGGRVGMKGLKGLESAVCRSEPSAGIPGVLDAGPKSSECLKSRPFCPWAGRSQRPRT